MAVRVETAEHSRNRTQLREPVGWYDVFLLLATSGMFGLMTFQGFREEVRGYQAKINNSPAVLVQADVPWSDCYPHEVFPDHHYRDPVVEFVMDQAPQLDPIKDTYRMYQRFLNQHSRINSYGTVFTYVVPDVDLDGRVCDITIGDEWSWLVSGGGLYEPPRQDGS